jgi:hypothetical protein|tara:strand:- start:1305 stop:1529 length:225 start_codon:yes stop_codon:yes gene_type:complete
MFAVEIISGVAMGVLGTALGIFVFKVYERRADMKWCDDYEDAVVDILENRNYFDTSENLISKVRALRESGDGEA